MPVQPVPSNLDTVRNPLTGIPVVEIANEIAGQPGIFGPFRDLGILDTAAIAKELATQTLPDRRTGVEKDALEIVSRFGPTFEVDVFQHDPENLAILFASPDVIAQAAGAVVVTQDRFNLTNDVEDFLDLANAAIDSGQPFTLTAAPISQENIGIGQGGTFGETTGDFSLSVKVNAFGDVTNFTVGGVARTVVAGTSPTAGQVGVVVGAVAGGGDLTFPSGEAPANGAAVVADIAPTFAFVAGTDFFVDWKAGRIRVIAFGGTTDALKAFQEMNAAYTYNAVANTALRPYVQFTRNAKARIRLLSDAPSINLIWDGISCQTRLTDDSFEFPQEGFLASRIAVKLLDQGGTNPFGTLRHFPPS